MTARLGSAGRLLATLALVASAACAESTGVELLQVEADGLVAGLVYLDADGSGTATAADEPLEGLVVVLATSRGTPILEATSDTAGAFLLGDVPAGSYILTLAPETVGDTLVVSGGEGLPVQVSRGDTLQVTLGVGFPSVTPEELGDVEEGRPVFVGGIALNTRLSFGEGRVHIRGAEQAIRILALARSPLGVGDSIRVRGRTARSAGQPILTDATAVVLVSQASIPVPRAVSTGMAATADGGRLDADLIRIQDADITDTATVNGDFLITVDDGSGSLQVVLESFLQIDPAPIRPDTIIQVGSLTGLLVPRIELGGAIRWRVFPRAPSDVTLEVKQVDLGLTKGVDFPVAAQNDTVTFEIVARNLGGLLANGVEVLDSLAVGFTLLEATASRGSFLASEGRWSLGTMQAGDADTLRLRTRVATGQTGSFAHPARFTPLVGEVDVNPSNNRAVATVQVVPADQKRADLQLETTASVATARPGDTIQFTLQLLNAGPLKASRVRILDSIPSGTILVEADASRGSYDPASGVWSLDSIPAGRDESLRLRVRVTAAAGATIVNRARSLNQQRENDPDPSNDQSSAEVSVVSSGSVRQPLPAATSRTDPGREPTPAGPG